MIKNRFRQTLSRDRCSIGVHPGFLSAELVEFCGLLGFDWVFLDAEHGGLTVEVCQALVRAAHGAGAGVVVRVPSAEPHEVLPYLETGAYTLAIPHVYSADRAKAAAAACYYPPLGIRGAGSSTRAANYGLTQTAADYFARANQEVLLLPQIEDVDAVRNLDEILAVREVEALLVGPGDLAASMGYPGQATHPEVVAAVDAVIAKAKAAGKLVGTVAWTPAAVHSLRAKGVDFVLCSAPLMLSEAARRYLKEARESPTAPPAALP
jgi:4-hydroxy-2-oxoheptanedioate aldolase